MNHNEQMDRVGDLVRLCAETMRGISRSKIIDTSRCPYRHIVRQLMDLSDEIHEITADLPEDWRHLPT